MSGKTLTKTGKGRIAGSMAYVDASTAKIIEILPTVVTNAGPLYSLTLAQDNPTLGHIRVDKTVLESSGVGAVQVRDNILVGPIDPGVNGFSARWAWRLPDTLPPPPPQAPSLPPRPPFPGTAARRMGILKSVHVTGVYAFLIDEQSYLEVFAHRSQLAPGAYFAVGRRYSFVVGSNAKGMCAVSLDFC